MSRISEIALAFKERGGKKLRPRLCKAVFEACRNAPGAGGGPGDIAAVCDAVECFHKASLIHDDIQDGDEARYGRPTTWREHGVAVAIAAGDWLVAHGYQLIARSGFGAMPRLLSAVVDSHVRLCEGQGDDLAVAAANPFAAAGEPFRAAAYLSVCERKTGEAFALAAQLGALAAGADDAPYRRFALAYGVLFQIADDLSDGAARPELLELKKEYEDKTALYRHECALGVW